MYDIAILGAGELGGSIAHVLALRDLARTIRLIDEHGQIAAGKALDIMQSAPIEEFTTTVTGTTDRFVAGSASIIIVADRAKGGEWQGEEGLLLLRQIGDLGRSRTVVCAGVLQRELVEMGVREAKFAPARLFGSAPEALAASARAIIALEADASVKEVALTIVGVPPKQIVIPWDDVTIAGRSAAHVISEPARRRVAARLEASWPPGVHALAHAAADAIAGLTDRSRRMITAFVAAAPEASYRERAAALPVRLSSRGATRAEMPALTGNARAAFDNALLK